MEIKGITIHNTNNDLSAQENYLKLLKDKKTNLCHYIVDEKEVIEASTTDQEVYHTKDHQVKESQDIMIEDKASNVEKISQDIPVLCFDAPYNQDVNNENVTRVYSWYQIYKYFLDKENVKLK